MLNQDRDDDQLAAFSRSIGVAERGRPALAASQTLVKAEFPRIGEAEVCLQLGGRIQHLSRGCRNAEAGTVNDALDRVTPRRHTQSLVPWTLQVRSRRNG